MSVIPSWAPNLHPMVVHFPIVLLLTALAADLWGGVVRRPASVDTLSHVLYAAAALAALTAYLTGDRAGETVLVPGMAQPVLQAHRTWALATAVYLAAVALLRILGRWRWPGRPRTGRWLLLVAGVIGAVLMQQTAERGAQLVFQHGVGVIGAARQP